MGKKNRKKNSPEQNPKETKLREIQPAPVPEETVEKTHFKPHRAFEKRSPEKVTGIRQSKVNPKTEALMQHEKHKRRIVVIFLVVAGVMGCVFLIYYCMNQYEKARARDKRANIQLERLATIERKIEEESDYLRERAARDAIRIAEGIIRMDYRRFATEMEEKIKKYEDILESSFPVLMPPDQPGVNFIAKSAMLDMVHIPAGEFYMGRHDNEAGGADELPRRKITLPYQFWIARTEITNWQMRKLVPGFRMKEWDRNHPIDGLNQPAGGVKYHNAELYCQKLTELERQAGKIPDHYEYRLPTEAEWEYACRGGTETIYFWGNEFGETGGAYANSLDLRAANIFGWSKGEDMNKNDGYVVSAPAGSFKPNPFGLHDMSGNLWEWCYDWYAPDAYNDSVTPSRSPLQNKPVSVGYKIMRPWDAGSYTIDTTAKVIRGGSWGNLPQDLRSAKRDFMPPQEENIGVGFRPVLAPKPTIPSKTENVR